MESKMLNVKIDGIDVSVPDGSTVLEAAHAAGVKIPTLCYLRGVNEIGSCRICMVEATGARGLVAACMHPATEGMEVKTNTEKLHKARKATLELILSNHNKKCLSCIRSGSCELQGLCHDYGVNEDEYSTVPDETVYDDSAVHMIRDDSKCILCRRCISACEDVQKIGVIGLVNRGFETQVSCAFDRPLGDVACISCGQCIVACPTGAIHEKDQVGEVTKALEDPSKFVVVFSAPSIRATLGECFGMPIGTDVTGKMATSMRRLGFDGVFDTNFSADLTIVEEAHELIDRIQNGGTLPLITSCSPGWIKFCEHYYPEMIPNLSTCKSPQQMFGAIVKTFYAQKNNLDPKNIVCVSIIPCTAKKFEIGRPDQDAAGVPDVDIALTTREYARLVKLAGIDFVNLPDGDFDHPLGASTGAAVIFGTTGGVMEAALRTAVSALTGKEDDSMIVFNEVRGGDGIRTATYKVAGMDINVAVASGTGNARKLLERIKAGEKFHFIEIMGCPGGCINGGGQPQQSAEVRSWTDLIGLRSSALYKNDERNTIRRSHQNPDIIRLYKEFLDKPGSRRAHEILHTSYVARKKF